MSTNSEHVKALEVRLAEIKSLPNGEAKEAALAVWWDEAWGVAQEVVADAESFQPGSVQEVLNAIFPK